MTSLALEFDHLTDGLTGEDFRKTFRHHPAGVAVITGDDGTGPVALTATSVISISAEPPLIVFSASALSSSTSTLRSCDSLVVHLLSSEQHWLAKLGATSGVDRFSDLEAWTRLATGEPRYLGVPVWIRARVAAQISAGASTLFVLHALESHCDVADAAGATTPLVYHDREWHGLTSKSKIEV